MGRRRAATNQTFARDGRRIRAFAFVLVSTIGLVLALSGPAFAGPSVDQDRDGRMPGLGLGSDCDDRDPSVYYGAPDPTGDSFDQNCDNAVDNDFDGYSKGSKTNGDCNDANASINYGATEIAGNSVDENCDEVVLPDIDGDGAHRLFVRPDGSIDPTRDCNDGRREIGPHATEIAGNGVDENCDGVDAVAPRPAVDQDRDGRSPGLGANTDCDDRDPSVYYGAADPTGDAFDQNCDHAVDADGDGYSTAPKTNGDCNDADPKINNGAAEIAGNAVDENCDEVVLADVDLDGAVRPYVRGDGTINPARDCNDARSDIGPHALDVADNGVDENCDGVDATPPTTNLIANGSFEDSLSGWLTSNSTAALAHDGITGPGAARVTVTGSLVTGYGIYPWPRPVTSTFAGRTYRSSAWVRSDTPGRTLCLRLREYSSSGTLVKGSQSCVTAERGWAQFPPVTFTTVTNRGSIAVKLYQSTAPRTGDSFELDGAVFTRS